MGDKRRALARAWEAGYAACCADAATLTHEGPFAALTRNPYREPTTNRVGEGGGGDAPGPYDD